MEEADLRKIFNTKKSKRTKNKNDEVILSAGFSPDVSFDQFKDWFDQSKFEDGCHYCHTTNTRSAELYTMQRNNKRNDGTRGGKRGKRLELDRADPSLSYDELKNLVWCCYWCNNAKSNFFSELEFKPIAEAIGEVLKKIN